MMVYKKSRPKTRADRRLKFYLKLKLFATFALHDF